MTPNSTATTDLIGSVFVFPLERLKRYCAFQIVAVTAPNTVVIAALDWIGTTPPADAAELAGVGRMIASSQYWRPHEILRRASLPIPESAQHIGTLPVAGDAEADSTGWNIDDIVLRQVRWASLPQDVVARFEEATTSTRIITVPGLVYARTGAQVETQENATTQLCDDGGYRLTDDFRLSSLRAWPLLRELRLHAWRDDLIPFLECSPILGDLLLHGHGRPLLDLSHTHLTRLDVDVTDLERLVLPESIDDLVLSGRATGPLEIRSADDGRWLSLRHGADVQGFTGLENVRRLRIDVIADLSVADIASRHPDLRALFLFGAPGTLRDVPALSKFPLLEELWLCDLFGFAPEDLPAPAALPGLRMLDLDSVPADVAAAAKQAFAHAPGISLTVRKPRQPEWAAENLDNPLRVWDGRSGIPSATAKKSSAAWRTARSAVRQPDIDASAALVAVTTFIETLSALNQKQRFIDTLEHDEIICAVRRLAEGVSAQGRETLDAMLDGAFDV